MYADPRSSLSSGRFGGEICHNSLTLVKTRVLMDDRDGIAVRYDANAGKIDWIKNGVHVAAIDCPKNVMMYPMACIDQAGEKIQLKGMVTGIESFYKVRRGVLPEGGPSLPCISIPINELLTKSQIRLP